MKICILQRITCSINLQTFACVGIDKLVYDDASTLDKRLNSTAKPFVENKIEERGITSNKTTTEPSKIIEGNQIAIKSCIKKVVRIAAQKAHIKDVKNQHAA